MLVVLVSPLPYVILEPQNLIIPVSKQACIETCAAVWLISAHQRGQDVCQHLAQGVVYLQTSEISAGVSWSCYVGLELILASLAWWRGWAY